LRHGDWVSVTMCRVQEQSSRVRTEIYELRHTYKIRIVTINNFPRRSALYLLEDTEENIKRVDFLLKKYKK